MNKPTPGPWRWVSEGRDGEYLSSPGYKRNVVLITADSDTVRNAVVMLRDADGIMQGSAYFGGFQNHPDGRLIAAAPELLAACQAMLNAWDSGIQGVGIEKIQVVLKKLGYLRGGS